MLKGKVSEIWNFIDSIVTKKLVHSMERRVKEIINDKGGAKTNIHLT